MELRRFGKTGLEVSLLVFGSASIGFLNSDQRQVVEILNLLLDNGVNVIDTAAAYPGAEKAIGEAVSRRRDEYHLISKCGEPGEDANSPAWSPASLLETVDQALVRLRTSHLDVMLLHSCSLETLERGEALGVLVQARDAGKIRFVGYLGDNEAAAHAAGLDAVSVIETSVNMCDQANIDAVLPIARERDLGVIAKRPIANAAWKDIEDQAGMYREYAATYTHRLAQMQIAPADLGFAAEPDLGYEAEPVDMWPEIGLRFTLSQPGVHTAIVGTTNPDHVRMNLAIVEQGGLPEEAIARLRAAFKKGEKGSGVAWVGQI